MSTIPASDIVQISPAVISAGGNPLVFNGLMLTQNSPAQGSGFASNAFRVPTGSILSFASAAAVGAYFGLSSQEYAKASIYFQGYVGCTQLPAALLVTQFTQDNVAAWLQSGQINTLTLPALQAVSGSLTVTVDNYPRTIASVSALSGWSTLSSYSAAATILQTGLNTTLPTEAIVATSTISAGAGASFTGSIADDILTVTAVTSGTITIGGIVTGTGVTAGTLILEQLTSTAVGGTLGTLGTYSVSTAQTVSSTAITETWGVLTVGSITSGTPAIGQTVTGGTTSAGTVITGGTTSPWIVNNTQSVVSGTLTLTATAVAVAFDSVSGSFVITSGITGTPSAAAYATGTAAASLLFTSATGATLSQGALGLTPSAFMASIVAQNQNWVSFFNLIDPDGGAGNAQKLAFAAWTSAQNNRYAYIAWDSDTAPTLSASATTSLGYLVNTTYAYAGTSIWYDPANTGVAAFIAGAAASINFNATNGRVTFKFRQQAGLAATVSSQQVANNLRSNNYNFIGVWATANQNFIQSAEGTVSGPFKWLDSLYNEIWMNSQFQLAWMVFLQQVGSVPYNTAGYTQIESALQSQIVAAQNFGAIRSGVTLSSTQVIAINTMAGFPIDATVTNQGYYLLVQPASAQVRGLRQSPTILFFYTDGQSVHYLTLGSNEVA